MQLPRELDTYWSQHYPCLPLAFMLREACSDRWFRIHTLPESKRCPDNEAEYQQILRRHNQVLQDCCSASRILVITTVCVPTSNPPATDGLMLTSRFWRSLDLDQIDEGDGYWHLFVTELNWHMGALDHVLRCVANDEITNVLVLNTRRQWLYHPYDGGGDIILASSAEREQCRMRYRTWAAPRPDGL